MARGTIANILNILRQHGIEPGPERSRKTTWKEFLSRHWELIVAADFFTIEVWTRHGLQRFVVLFFIELSTRKVEVAGIARLANGLWMSQIARNLTDADEGILNGKRYLIHDRDTLFTAEFLNMLADAGVKSVKLPPRSPNLNAYAERFVRTIKESCLDRLIFFGESSLRTPGASMSTIRCVALIVLCSVSNCYAQSDPSGKDWLMHGRTYDDHRFSPLREINEQNVATLGLAWSHELDTTRGLEATPLVKNGILYFTGAWSVVYAHDAKSGKLRWKFDPKVSRENAYFYCCDVVNRGVALYAGKVFVGTLDGRLVALSERTGVPEWTVNTVENNNRAYSITSAPRIARGKVVIGNAGSEYGVRGYVSAYDAETGRLSWRFYTVPGNPANGYESKAMEEAAKTWHGDWWTFGGGGTPWEGMAYDPDLDLLYFGTGNPTAWYRELRGGGDSLYTACILAVHTNNGELAWYFQTTPGDNWDYDATQPLVQADLRINGQVRKTIMQANKNGFFYVLDRQTGEFITGSAFVDGINWAKGLDEKGRPIENPGVTELKARLISPGPFGGHNWTPMAFGDSTGLVYVSAKSGTFFLHAPGTEVKYDPDRWNLGLIGYQGPLSDQLVAALPARGELLAWDPVAEKAAWHAPSPVAETGGVLATAGNLVFQGRGDGIFLAYRATDGHQLWSFDAGTGIIAAPVTYSVDGEQYVTVLAGWGGASGLISFHGYGPVKPGYGRILTFKLNSHARFTPPIYKNENPPANLTSDASPELTKKGGAIYGGNCSVCHGVDAIGGPVPDLRYLSRAKLDHLEDIVLRGALSKAGMPSFSKILKAEDVDAIRAYLISRSRELAAQK